MAKEPAVVSGAVLAVVEALLACLMAFGVNLSPVQSGAIVGLATALMAAAPIVTSIFVRQKVTPVGKE